MVEQLNYEIKAIVIELNRQISNKSLSIYWQNNIPKELSDEADMKILSYRQSKGLNATDINNALSYAIWYDNGYFITKGTGILIDNEIKEVTVLMYKKNESDIEILTDSIENPFEMELLRQSLWSANNGRSYMEVYLNSL